MEKITAQQVRRILLGQEGPWADPRVAIDARDNLEELWRGLDSVQLRELAEALEALFGDPDPVVRTGAVLFFHHLVGKVDARMIVDAIDRCGALLEMAPTGFSGGQATLLDTLAVDAARSLRPGDPSLQRVAALLARPGVRAVLLISMAMAVPDDVARHASTWATVEDTGALVSLPLVDQRVRFAQALAPWPERAVDIVSDVAGWQKWSTDDRERVLGAMRG